MRSQVDLVQRIQQEVISGISQPFYISLNGKHAPLTDEKPFDLFDETEKFITKDSSKKVLLLLGNAGSGKSVFCHELIARLWKKYKPRQSIPLLIPLPLLENPFEQAIEKTLKSFNFSDIEITELKKKQKFIFIFDGYDELHQFKNLYTSNKLHEWNCKVIVTCCKGYLYRVQDSDSYFMPYKGKKRQPSMLKKFYVAPFSEKQIEGYVKHYESQQPKESKDQSPVFQQLKSVPGLAELMSTPFLLHLAIESFPDILGNYQDKKDQDLQTMTQAALYDLYIDKWFRCQEKKLLEKKLKDGQPFDDKEDIKPKLWQYCQSFAQAMRERNLTYVMQDRNKNDYFEKLLSADPSVELVRSSCPIREFTKRQFGFIHATLIDYFATKQLYDEIIEIPMIMPEKSSESSDVKDIPPPPLQKAICKSYYLTPWAIQLNAHRLKTGNSEKVKAIYFAYIEASKTDSRYAIAAANSISALNAAEISFSGMNFSKVQIPHADLNQAILDEVNFINANLTHVNLENAWLRRAYLEDAHMQGVQLGESSFIQKNDRDFLIERSYSPNSNILAIASGSNIALYDVKTKAVRVLEGHTLGIETLVWDAKGEYLASGGHDTTLRIWEVASGKQVHVLQTHRRRVSSLAWDSKSARIASGSSDGSVDVWDVARGKFLRTMQGREHTVVLSLAWDPTGEYLAIGFSDTSDEDTIYIRHNYIQIGHVASGHIAQQKLQHGDGVTSIDWDQKGERIASGSYDNTVRVWERGYGTALRVFQGHTSTVYSVAWDSKGERIASGDFDGSVRVWDVTSGEELCCLKLPKNVTNVSWQNHHAEEVLAVVFGSSIGFFVLKSIHQVYSFHLKSLIAPRPLLFLDKVNITGAVGLDETNQRLFRRGGAIGRPAKIKQVPAPSDENKKMEIKWVPPQNQATVDNAQSSSQAVSQTSYDPRIFGVSGSEAKANTLKEIRIEEVKSENNKTQKTSDSCCDKLKRCIIQ